MGKKELGANRQYTGEFKAEALRLHESSGVNTAAKRPPSELESEFARLRRELTNAELNLEIVKRGGGVFREGVAVKYT